MSGKIGRPKKSISTDPSLFHNITDKPKKSSSIIEFSNTEPFNMSKYLKTLKSNRVSPLYITCMREKVIFWGKITPKQFSHELAIDTNNYMYLQYDCRNIYRYYCARKVFISITDKDSIVNLLGEISESSRKIKMVIDKNIENYIEFKIYNGALKCRCDMSIKCEIEFDKPEKIPRLMTHPKLDEDLFCEMKYIDVGEYKKDLNTKFKKKVNDTRILITPDVVIVNHKKDATLQSESIWKASKPGDVLPGEQSVSVRIDRQIEMKFPKQSIVNFLLHVKGKFHIMFYKNVTVLVFIEDNIILLSELGPDSS